MSFHVPEKFRVQGATDDNLGNNGFFLCRIRNNQLMKVIASDGMGWEHVSVSRTDRCPTWEEMCQIKNLFWDETDCVVQYHPAKSDYVNNHPYCLHLWRPISTPLPVPPTICV